VYPETLAGFHGKRGFGKTNIAFPIFGKYISRFDKKKYIEFILELYMCSLEMGTE